MGVLGAQPQCTTAPSNEGAWTVNQFWVGVLRPPPAPEDLPLHAQSCASPFRPAGSPRFCMKLNRSSRNSFLLGSPSSSYSYEGKEGTG